LSFFAIGSGCIAALEAEKFLAESDAGNETPAVATTAEHAAPTEKEKEKENDANGVVLECRSNSLL
jgi:thioredoxin reductase (NADPH)